MVMNFTGVSLKICNRLQPEVVDFERFFRRCIENRTLVRSLAQERRLARGRRSAERRHLVRKALPPPFSWRREGATPAAWKAAFLAIN
jgi:hypothetical protein